MTAIARPKVPADVAGVLRALDSGNWPGVRNVARSVPVRTTPRAHLLALLIEVAWSMELQARGDVQGADQALSLAARRLPVGLRRPRPSDRWAADVRAASRPTQDGDELLFWLAARLVCREQLLLDHCVSLVRQQREKPEEVLVLGFVEHLRRVEGNPYLYVGDRSITAITYEVKAIAQQRRATSLVHLADPSAGSIGDAAWRAVGRCAGLRCAARMWLVTHPLLPEAWPVLLPEDTPVPRGHVAAHRDAVNWYDDLRSAQDESV